MHIAKSMKKLFFIILVLSSFSVVNAEINNMNKTFSMICEAEQSTGFRWNTSDWKRMNWTLPKIVISKQKNETTSDPDLVNHVMCAHNQKGYSYNEMRNITFVDACYLIKDFGTEDSFLNYRTCREQWGGSPLSLKKVECLEENDPSGIIFKPNAWFTKFHISDAVANNPEPLVINGNTLVEAGHKDDMSIYVGRCSTF